MKLISACVSIWFSLRFTADSASIVLKGATALHKYEGHGDFTLITRSLNKEWVYDIQLRSAERWCIVSVAMGLSGTTTFRDSRLSFQAKLWG